MGTEQRDADQKEADQKEADQTGPDGQGQRRRRGLALITLGLGAFAIGTAELILVGILDVIATDLAVPVSTAGQLVTAYALGISIGGPLLTAITTRFGRRTLLRMALAVFLAGNLLALFAVDIGALLAARVITGAVHGLFVGVASVAAAALVPPQRRGSAMSMIFGGIAVATVVGVPLGTLVGQHFGWRAAFAGVVALSVVVLIGTLIFVPPISSAGAGGLATQAGAALAPRVLAMLGVGTLLLGGQFTVFTYLTPYLHQITGIHGGTVSIFLLAYGLFSIVGTAIGGRFADRIPTTTLTGATLVLILALIIVYARGGSPVLMAIALGLWGIAGLGLVPAFQVRVLGLAGPGADLAATLGASAVNIGIAGGAALGGWVMASYGIHAVALTGLSLIIIALPATVLSGLLHPPPTAPPVTTTQRTTRTTTPYDIEE